MNANEIRIVLCVLDLLIAELVRYAATLEDELTTIGDELTPTIWPDDAPF